MRVSASACERAGFEERKGKEIWAKEKQHSTHTRGGRGEGGDECKSTPTHPHTHKRTHAHTHTAKGGGLRMCACLGVCVKQQQQKARSQMLYVGGKVSSSFPETIKKTGAQRTPTERQERQVGNTGYERLL